MKYYAHPTAVIYPNVTIEDGVYIGAFCIIGAPAESKKYWLKDNLPGVVIMKGAILTGHVTVDAGTVQPTIIGQDAFIMKHSYIAHDCFVCQGAIISAGVKLAGAVEVGVNTNLGMGVAVHQGMKVPSGCMIGMNATVTKKTDLKADGVYVGSPAKFIRWNRR